MNTKIFSTGLFFTFLFCLGFGLKAQTYVELPLPQSNQIVLKYMFQVGSMNDFPTKAGLTYMTSKTIEDGGTLTMTSQEIKDKFFPWAASFSVTVDKEVTVFTFVFPVEFASGIFPILSDLLHKPAFAKDDFERVKSNNENFLTQVIRNSNDEELSKRAFENTFYLGSNYEHLVEGKLSELPKISAGDCKDHYFKYFNRNTLTVGIAGNYSPEFYSKIKKDAELFSSTPTPASSAGKPFFIKNTNATIITKEGALGSAIFMGAQIPVTRKNDEFAALMVANSWLGEHRKSYGKLYQKIRAERSMNYGAYSYIEWYNSGGQNMLPKPGFPRSSNYFAMWIRPVQTAASLKSQYKELKSIKIGHAHFAIRMALRQLNTLVTDGMNKEDFELTRQFLRSYIKLYAQTPSDRLGYLMESRFFGRKDYLAEMDGLLEKLTLADVNNAIKKYLNIANWSITVVTDVSEAQELAASFRENRISPMSYSKALMEVLPPSILEEDKLVENFPTNIKDVKIITNQEPFK